MSIPAWRENIKMGLIDDILRAPKQEPEEMSEEEFDYIVSEAVEDKLFGYVSQDGLPKRTLVTKAVPYRFGKNKSYRREREVL